MSDAELVAAALEYVAPLDVGVAARVLEVSETTLSDWRLGARPKLKGPTKRKLQVALARGDMVRESQPIYEAVSRTVLDLRSIERLALELLTLVAEARRHARDPEIIRTTLAAGEVLDQAGVLVREGKASRESRPARRRA